jgi:pyruvate dehydrogenase E1 component alpha subunit
MSDPGVTYRTREQVQHHRKEKDCIGYIRRLLLENSFATEAELEVHHCINSELIDDEARKQIDEAVDQAVKDPFPTAADLTTDIYVDNENRILIFHHPKITSEASLSRTPYTPRIEISYP